MKYDIVIIGGGAAGLAAAQSAYDPGLSILIIEKEEHLGGILNQCIHTGFGLEVFQEELTGPEYADRFIKTLPKEITFLLHTTVLDIIKKTNIEIVVSNQETGRQILETKALIITSGCYEKTRGAVELPGERPRGVMSAGSAQRYLNMDGYLVGKKIFIVGSGDIGLIMARRMSLEGASVLGVAEIMPYSNGLNRNIVQCLHDFDIPLYVSHKVVDIKGKDVLEKISIQQVDAHFNAIPGTIKSFEVDTLLLSVGLIPDITLFDSIQPLLDPLTKSMVVDQHYESSIPGIFIAGNALHVHDLVDYVTLESQKAGVSAKDYVQNQRKEKQIIAVKKADLIRYVVPQVVDYNYLLSDIELLLRVNKPMAKAIFSVVQNQQVILKKSALYLVPSEMVKLIIKKGLVRPHHEIMVQVQEVEG